MGAQEGTKIVALLGVSGSGKSLVARRLYEHHGLRRIRFADAERDMLKAGFGLTDEELDGARRGIPQARFGGCPPQHLFHTLAHNWGRSCVHSDLWANEWGARVDRHPGEIIIADDLQRPNEAAAVVARGGLIVRVTRPGYRPANPNALARQAHIAHHVELVNDGTPDALIERADIFLTELRHALAQVA